ncbi:MAG: rRNA maturation RNase YbeY [Thermaurantimonas sp.]
MITELINVFRRFYPVNFRNIVLTNLFLDDMLALNSNVLKHNYYTDVITFCSLKKNFIDVEIFICLDYVDKFCLVSEKPIQWEYIRTFYHALLHCVGFNDSTQEEKQIMTEKEKELTDLFYTFHVKH